jgi:hypothetical protein
MCWLSGTFTRQRFTATLISELRISGRSSVFTLRRIDHGRLPILRLSKIAHTRALNSYAGMRLVFVGNLLHEKAST